MDRQRSSKVILRRWYLGWPDILNDGEVILVRPGHWFRRSAERQFHKAQSSEVTVTHMRVYRVKK